MTQKKNVRGRPVEYPMPERIDAPPEEIAEVVLGFTPPANREDWAYMRKWRADMEAKRLKGGEG